MKRVICDTCGAQTEPDAYGFAPSGSEWISVSRRKVFTNQDFCSAACAITALSPGTPQADITLTVPCADARPVTSAETQEFIDTGRFTPAPVDPEPVF